MVKVRSLSELDEALSGELTWRIQEIHMLKKAIAASEGVGQSALIRAGVALLYAHWEGFIKGASLLYAAYLSRKNLKYDDVLEAFKGLRALGMVREMEVITKRLFVAAELLEKIYALGSETVVLPLEKHLSNVGNLNYSLLEQIVMFFGFDIAAYSSKKALIDESLLKQRNDIAHGEYLSIDWESFDNLVTEVVGLMRTYEAHVSNAAVSKAYLRAVPAM